VGGINSIVMIEHYYMYRYIESHQAQFIQTLRDAVAIRSISALPEARSEVVRMVKWTVQRLNECGVTVELRKIGEQVSGLLTNTSFGPRRMASLLFPIFFFQTTCDGAVIPLPPVIFGNIGADPNKKTLLVYGHLDVQPAKIVRIIKNRDDMFRLILKSTMRTNVIPLRIGGRLGHGTFQFDRVSWEINWSWID